MNQARAMVLALLALVQLARADTARTSRPWKQASYTIERRDDPKLALHRLVVDLSDPSVRLRVSRAGDDPDAKGPWQTTLMTVREIARRDGLDLAVNGDFFRAKDLRQVGGRQVRYFVGNWAATIGRSMSDGNLWSDSSRFPSLLVHESGRMRIARFTTLPKDARQIISGNAMLVEEGKNVAGPATQLAPRTAVGIDRAAKTLILLVVDGRRPDHSVGMTVSQLAEEMIRLGAHQALNLDGGGSTTLVVREPGNSDWKVINTPSDGSDLFVPISVERPVANVLGVTLGTSAD